MGNDENNLYRIVSHETRGLTKITSAEPLKKSGSFVTSAFGDNNTFSSSNTIGTFLNGEYLTNYVDSSYSNMIESNTTWYLGHVSENTSYKLAKYADTNMSSLTLNTTDAKIGLLRFGELMAGQFDVTNNNSSFCTLTPFSSTTLRCINYSNGAPDGGNNPSELMGIKPALNLKQNIIITSGDGTLQNPFEIELAS